MPLVNERAFGSADFGASLRGVYMHLKALAELARFMETHQAYMTGSFCVHYIDAVHTTHIE